MQDVNNNIPEEVIMHHDEKEESKKDEIKHPDEHVSMHDEAEEEEEEEEEDQQHTISSEVIADYRRLIQMLSLDQTIFRLRDHDEEEEEKDLISLFPDLILYTAPDGDCIGNDPYFDEAEYNRIVPFKLSTQRLVLQKCTRKRDSEGIPIFHPLEENLEPRHEQLSRNDCIFYTLFLSNFYL